MKEKEMEEIAEYIVDALKHTEDESYLAKIKEKVTALTDRFPMGYKKIVGID